MAFIAPLLAPVIGVFSGLTAGAVGQAVIGIGLSIGANYLTRRKKPEKSSAPRGMSLSLRVENNEFREVILGRAATAGSLKYHNTYGPNGNDYLQLLFVLADHECDGLAGMFVDGKAVTFGSNVTSGPVTGLIVNQYSGTMWVKFHSGAWDQTADADLVEENSSFSSNFRGRGICYARVTIKYNAQKYPNGVPSFLFVVRGAKLYDWREDETAGGEGDHLWDDPSTHEYSENPAVCLYNWMRGIYVNGDRLAGMNARGLSFPLADWTAAANACDESVSLAGEGDELRYRMGGVIPVDTQNSAVVSEILTAMAGELVDSGGVFRPIAGVAQSSVMTITDDDLMADDAVEITPKLSRGSLINAVFGTFQDPLQVWEAAALPPRISPDDEESDGGIRLEDHYSLGFVWSGTQGQRICEILRRKGRFQRQVSLKLRSRFAVVEAGDWVTWNSARYGYDGVKWEVVNAALNRDLTVTIQLRETSESIFAWTAGEDELDPDDPQPVSAGGSTFDTVAGFSVANILVESGGASQRPGLRIEWTPIDDETVVEIELEFRREGDEAAQSRKIFDPTFGSYEWVDGIQGGTEYEVRVRPVTLPPRPVVWTGWTSPNEDSAAQVVEVAALAIAVPQDTITEDMLSPQSRFLLGLITATDEVLGSVYQQVQQAVSELNLVAQSSIQSLAVGSENQARVRVERTERVAGQEALAQQITTAQAQISGVSAAVQQEITARIAQGSALAQSIDTVTTQVGDQELTVQVLAQSIDGIQGRVGLVMSSDNVVLGYALLDGTPLGSTFTVAASAFQVALFGQTGGDPVPVFGISLVNGEPRLALRGDMLSDGSIAARHISAISIDALAAAFQSATIATVMQSADTANGRLVLDFANPSILLTTAE